jgi:hypothetical protein
MESVRKSWTDERLDALNDRVDRLSDRVDRGFDRIDADLRALSQRFDALHRLLILLGGLMVAALIGLIATQL